MSFGPKPKGVRGIQFALKTVRDTIFRGRLGIGKPPLQTRLTTDLVPFAEIRREMDKFYEEAFPSQEDFDEILDNLHSVAMVNK